MFGELMESNPRSQPRRGGALVSVAVHVGAIVLGAWATAGSAPAPLVPDREVPDAEYTVPLQPRPSSPAPARPRSPSPATPAAPTIPIVETGTSFEIPDALPPIDEPLGDPMAEIERLSRAATIGIGAHGPGPGPASVIDNLVADKPALPREGNPSPAYPELLRTAGIEGTVEVEFIIEPNGRVRPGSIVIVQADHPRFADAVREALARSAYYAAVAGGRAVAVRVRQRFTFELD